MNAMNVIIRQLLRKEATKPLNLKKHVSTKHDGRRYDCGSCESQFMSKPALKSHRLRVHEGHRYQCSLCKENFSSNNTLKNHIITKHDGVAFECDMCDYKVDTKKVSKSIFNLSTRGCSNLINVKLI